MNALSLKAEDRYVSVTELQKEKLWALLMLPPGGRLY